MRLTAIALVLCACVWMAAGGVVHVKAAKAKLLGLAHGKHHKRGVLSSVPPFKLGHDIPLVTHSVVKPVVVSYPPTASIAAVKVPLSHPLLPRYPVGVGHRVPHLPHPHYGLKFPHHTKAALYPKPDQHFHHHHHHVSPRPLVPVVPAAPLAATPVVPVAAPTIAQPYPLPSPPVFVPQPAPLPPPLHVHPLRPAFPAGPAPVVAPAYASFAPQFPYILRPGGAIQSSVIATYPRYPFANYPAPLIPLSASTFSQIIPHQYLGSQEGVVVGQAGEPGVVHAHEAGHPSVHLEPAQPGFHVHPGQPEVQFQSASPGVHLHPEQPDFHLQPGVHVHSAQPELHLQPGVNVHGQPDVHLQSQPGINLQPAQPDFHLQPGQPDFHLQPAQPDFHHQPAQPDFHLQPAQPDFHLQPTQPDFHLQPGHTDVHLQPAQPDYHGQPGHPEVHFQQPQPDFHSQSGQSDVHLQAGYPQPDYNQPGVQVQPTQPTVDSDGWAPVPAHPTDAGYDAHYPADGNHYYDQGSQGFEQHAGSDQQYHDYQDQLQHHIRHQIEQAQYDQRINGQQRPGQEYGVPQPAGQGGQDFSQNEYNFQQPGAEYGAPGAEGRSGDGASDSAGDGDSQLYSNHIPLGLQPPIDRPLDHFH